MTDLKKIEKAANELKTVENVNRELKRIASVKCRLKKQKGRADYSDKMTEILQQEQILKEAKNLIKPAKKTVTTYTQNDVDLIEDYDELAKAIRTIQSKKTLSRWLTTIEGDNDEFRNAEKIERMLIERRKLIKPVDDVNIRKTDVQKIIDTIESSGNISQGKIVELLKNVIQ
ncbi:MAG TPA: hypothetical protein VFC74_06975 [Oscillospiraceae bacterium]|nr:hypothetical protein [Oscillospiraceae bacterium]